MLSKFTVLDVLAVGYFAFAFPGGQRIVGYLIAALFVYRVWQDVIPPDDKATWTKQNWFWRKRFSVLDIILAAYLFRFFEPRLLGYALTLLILYRVLMDVLPPEDTAYLNFKGEKREEQPLHDKLRVTTQK